MFAWLLTVGALLWLTCEPALSATVELSGRGLRFSNLNIIIEGRIETGDAAKFLRLYDYYGLYGSTVYLRSTGGNVQEAMKIGRLIRRFRLATSAPYRSISNSFDRPRDSTNNICASACVLIWMGGAYRDGDALVFHRPSLPRDIASNITDQDYENTEHAIVIMVRHYLEDMELEPFYIEKLISTDSQDGYIPSEADLKAHALTPGFPPSINEIVLSKCPTISPSERHEYYVLHLRNGRRENERVKQVDEKMFDWFECQQEQLGDIAKDAWSRELTRLANFQCAGQLRIDNDKCIKLVSKVTEDEVFSRTLYVSPGSVPPNSYSVDTSIIDDISTNR